MTATRTLALCALCLGGCPLGRTGLEPRAHDSADLAASATLFWRSLRWGDFETASALIEEPTPRLTFLERWTVAPPVQITEFQIVHVEVPAAVGDRLEGTSVVRVEGVPLGSNVLSVQMLTQTWYRHADHWYLDPGSAPYQEAP